MVYLSAIETEYVCNLKWFRRRLNSRDIFHRILASNTTGILSNGRY